MRNYDDIEGFINYTNEDEWKKYIESYVIPLWRYSWILKEYWEELKNEFDALPFNEIRKEEKPLILGGIVQRDEIYTKNSLAKFYANFFGMRLKDIQSWILQSQTGEMLTEISVEVVETELVKFIKEVFNLLDYALLHHQQLVTDFQEPELDYEGLKKDSHKVKEIIQNFYQNILNISLNYNYGTFFLCSINQITYCYMKTAYPRIDDVLDFLMSEFGLTELKWDNPIKPESTTFRDYTIYCFPEYHPNKKGKSFGGAICTLNEKIWSVFSKSSEIKNTLNILFRNIPNLKEEFRKRVRSRLPERYHTNIYFEGILASERSDVKKTADKTIMKMLDENSPFLFTNHIKISYASSWELKFEEVG